MFHPRSETSTRTLTSQLTPGSLVALATGTLIGKVHPPLQGKKGTSVVQAKEMNNRDPWNSKDVLVPQCQVACGLSEDQGRQHLFNSTSKNPMQPQSC